MKNTIKVEIGKTRMVAHRGVSGLEAENTCAAFVAAGNRSYFGIETDVHVTVDGGLVCIHDDNTLRTSGFDLVVEQSKYDTLRSLRLFTREGGKDRADLCIPDLAEYISICRDYGKVAVLELKNAMTKESIAKIAEVICGLSYFDGTVFISFCLENLTNLRELYPDAKAQYLTSKYSEKLIETLSDNRLDLDIRHTEITSPDMITLMHSKGIKVNVWTVDTSERCRELSSFGVDYITSNICE